MTVALPKPPFVPPQITSGLCYVIFAYDAARSIDLERADRRVGEITERPSIRHKRRTPSYFEYQPPPLRVSRDAEPLRIGSFTTRPSLDLMAYDFGAIAVIYALPIAGPFENLLSLSEELYDNETLLTDARLQVDQLIKVIGDAANQPHLSPVVEDYVIFHIESFTEPFEPEQFCTENRRQIAQILRAERQELSEQEVEDALAVHVISQSYSPGATVNDRRPMRDISS